MNKIIIINHTEESFKLLGENDTFVIDNRCLCKYEFLCNSDKIVITSGPIQVENIMIRCFECLYVICAFFTFSFLAGGSKHRNTSSDSEQEKSEKLLPFATYYSGMKVLKEFNKSTGFKIYNDAILDIVSEYDENKELFHYFSIQQNENKIPLYLFYHEDTYRKITHNVLTKIYGCTIFVIFVLAIIWLHIMNIHTLIVFFFVVPFTWIMIELLYILYNFRKRFYFLCDFLVRNKEIELTEENIDGMIHEIEKIKPKMSFVSKLLW